MTEAFICDAIRTPVGRYNGGLSAVRVDDLAAHPIKALMQGKLKLTKGHLPTMIRYVESSKQLLSSAQSVQSEFRR